jgi:hypothetical protein
MIFDTTFGELAAGFRSFSQLMNSNAMSEILSSNKRLITIDTIEEYINLTGGYEWSDTSFVIFKRIFITFPWEAQAWFIRAVCGTRSLTNRTNPLTKPYFTLTYHPLADKITPLSEDDEIEIDQMQRYVYYPLYDDDSITIRHIMRSLRKHPT